MHDTLNIGGWIFLVSSWSIIIGLNVWCFTQIFKERTEEIVEPLVTEENQSS